MAALAIVRPEARWSHKRGGCQLGKDEIQAWRVADDDGAGRDPSLRWKAGTVRRGEQRFECASRRSAVPGQGFCDRIEV